MTVNEKIANGQLESAVNEVYEAIRFLINAHVPFVDLSQDEFAKIAPMLVEKFQDPTKFTEADAEPTEDIPGDDVTVTPARGVLTVKFKGPENDPDFTAPADVKRNVAVGGVYNYVPPTFVDYTASTRLISGTMTANGVEVTVTYTKNASATSGSTESGSSTETPASGGSTEETGGEDSGN